MLGAQPALEKRATVVVEGGIERLNTGTRIVRGSPAAHLSSPAPYRSMFSADFCAPARKTSGEYMHNTYLPRLDTHCQRTLRPFILPKGKKIHKMRTSGGRMTGNEEPHITARLRALRKRAGYSMDALAQVVGYRAASGYQRYESAAHYHKSYLPTDLVHRLLQVLVGRGNPPVTQTEVLELAGLANMAGVAEPVFEVPLISWVQAGHLTESVEPSDFGDVRERVVVPYRRESLFALEVRGNSMSRVAPDGSLIVVDYYDRELMDGKCYIFRVGGDTTFKRYRANPARLEPDSTESGHDTLFPQDGIEVVGRVVRVIISNP